MSKLFNLAILLVLLAGLASCARDTIVNPSADGCTDGHQCVLQRRAAVSPVLPPLNGPDPSVAIAVSGGGSRAAVFAAAVLEELAKVDASSGEQPVSILQRVRYMSSVSGGSLATAYYALNKPGKEVQVLTPEHVLSKDYAEFFARYQQQMAKKWEGALWAPLLDDATGRAFSIAKDWDTELFQGRTFQDLAQREASGDSPYVILNGTSWDNGRRFVFTNLPAAAFSYDFMERVTSHLKQSSLSRDEIELLDERMKPEAARFRPITAEEIGADLSNLKVSMAVASSASVPLLIGPVLYSVGPVNCHKGSCLHIGDGGMFDNQGVESLAQVLFPDLLGQTAPGAQAAERKALMIIIDGSYPMHDVKFGQARSLLTYLKVSPSRVSDIMEERALGYQVLLWSILRADTANANGVIPDERHLHLVHFRHIDAAQEIAANPDGICGWSQPLSQADVAERLRMIPTRFQIDSKCNAALLKRAAKILVQKNKSRLLKVFSER